MADEISICTGCGCDCGGSCNDGCGCGCQTCPQCGPACCAPELNQAVPYVAMTTPQSAGSGSGGTETVDPCCCLQTHDALRSDFTVPLVGSNITLEVCDEDNYFVGQELYVRGAGRFPIVSQPSDTTIEVTNDGRSSNAAPGTVVLEGEPMQGVPPIAAETILPVLSDTVCADFLMPAKDSQVEACISNIGNWACPPQWIYIPGHGYLEVLNIVDDNHADVYNHATIGNSSPGVTVPQGSCVFPVPPPPSELDPDAVPPADDNPSFLMTGELASSPGTAVTTAVVARNGNLTTRPNLFTVPDVKPTPLPLTTTQHDNRAGASLANDGWVVPEDGIYHLFGAAEVDENSLSGAYNLVIGVDSSNEGLHRAQPSEGYIPNAVTADVNVSCMTVVRLTAGERVSVYLQYEGVAGPVQILSSAGTPCRVENVEFGGFKVSD